MTWKDILKMPMPTNVGQQRDERYRQRIIDYEEMTIEPKLTEFFERQPSETEQKFAIKVIGGDVGSVDRWFPNEKPVPLYVVGTETTKTLGGNAEFVLKVIGELYDKEGYQVTKDGTNKILIRLEDDGTI
jgi:muramoyltetrapeptide carboxypeptidase LdcA involved in peptidoglycan recycling